MRVRAAVAGLLAVVGAVAIAETRQGSVVHLTEADDGKTIRVPVGLEIRARIAQPSGTSYRWEVRNDPHLALIEAPQSQVAYGTGMGRGREYRQFRIRVVRPGRFPLVFGLRPPATSGDKTPLRRIVVDVDAPVVDRDDRPDDRRRDRPGPDTVEPFTEADAAGLLGTPIDVPVDREMTIALPSNTSTGYHWVANFHRNLIVEDEIEEQRPRGAMIGGGGTSLVRFRVLRPGPAQVTLMYVPAPRGGTASKSLTYRFRGI